MASSKGRWVTRQALKEFPPMDAQRDLSQVMYSDEGPAIRNFTQSVEGYTIKVKRLSNGFVLTTTGWQGTFYPDLKSLIRAITIHIGGVDAVEVPDVSAEEAGLLSGVEPTLELTMVEQIINVANRFRQDTVLEGKGVPSWRVQQGIDGIFKAHGYADMHDFITCKKHHASTLDKLLTEFSNPEVAVKSSADAEG